jgi:hypothetical protein
MSTKTSQYMPPQNDKELVLAWIRRTRESQFSHYEMAQTLSRRGLWFGVPAIVISAAVGVSAFSSVAMEVIPAYAKIIIGLLSVAAAALSALQTFFKFSERAEKHKSAGVQYGCLRRKLEQLYTQPADKLDKKQLAELRQEMDLLAQESLHVPAHILPRVQSNVHFVANVSSEPGEFRAQQQ